MASCCAGPATALLVGGRSACSSSRGRLLSLLWTPYSATAIDIAGKLRLPSAGHWLGTDHFGRDIALDADGGAQNAVAVALVAVGFGCVLGVPLGALAAARRGWLDER